MTKFCIERWKVGEKPELEEIENTLTGILVVLDNGAKIRISKYQKNGVLLQTQHGAMSEPMVINPHTRNEISVTVGGNDD